jgi:hypothetical protein
LDAKFAFERRLLPGAKQATVAAHSSPYSGGSGGRTLKACHGRFDTGIRMGANTSIQPNSTITGPALPEPVQVHAVTPMGASARIMGVVRQTGDPFNAVRTADRLSAIKAVSANGSLEPDVADESRTSFHLPYCSPMIWDSIR